MASKIFTPEVVEKIQELAKTHCQSEISSILNIHTATLSGFVYQNNIVCAKHKRKKSATLDKVKKISVSPYVAPGLKFNAAKDFKPCFTSKPNIETIKKIVLNYFDVQEGDLLSKSRSQTVVWPRQLIHTLCYDITGRSLKDIGFQIGQRDHTTVINSRRIVRNMVETGNPRAQDYTILMGIIKSLHN